MATEQENVLFTGNIDLGVSKLAAIGAEKAVALKHEYVLPEHFVVEFVEHLLLIYPELREYVDLKSLKTQTKEYLNSLEKVKKIDVEHLAISMQTKTWLIGTAEELVENGNVIDFYLVLFRNFMSLKDSYALYFFDQSLNISLQDFYSKLKHQHFLQFEENDDDSDPIDWDENDAYASGSFEEDMDNPFAEREQEPNDKWENYVVCLNDMVKKRNPLVGRTEELERTIEVLCRKDKNNALHIGEPGVGKTALIMGLVRRIEEKKVPLRLLNSKVYQIDMADMIAGTHYRGEFEERFKKVLSGIAKNENSILYIDEIHTIVGTGAIDDSSLDASNILKPYLAEGSIRIVGATTYEEFNRYLAKNKSLVRRFQQIDIKEPTVEEAVDILEGIKKGYANYHNVSYSKDIIRYIVENSHKHISNRFLPDKAIDLLDEAGAKLAKGMSKDDKALVVTKPLIDEIMAKVCKIDAKALKDNNNDSLIDLKERILSMVYGQDEAVEKVVEAVHTAKAGLIDDDKPLASLLFVGPTGVGKTEVARVLAHEMGVELVRFDMSEYAEKHSVAKLIGAPSGYVGYEDGGLLTDAIRKTPNCVLLLDEVEKAHSDIYNILLQVMDYARLTDNKGNKADFRNVVLILTSNIGAQYAHQANVGFAGNVTSGQAMLTQVKKAFKPEFINRLSSIVVFNDMDKPMAERILQKKVAALALKLKAKKIELQLDSEAQEWLLKKGMTKKYGAREFDRVITRALKPLLTREILFGKLQKGGLATVTLENNELAIGVKKSSTKSVKTSK